LDLIQIHLGRNRDGDEIDATTVTTEDTTIKADNKTEWTGVAAVVIIDPTVASKSDIETMAAAATNATATTDHSTTHPTTAATATKPEVTATTKPEVIDRSQSLSTNATK